MRSKSFFKIILGFVLFVCIMNFNVFPYFWGNYSDSGFTDPGKTGIATDIIDGAGTLLKAYSGFLLFSNQIEVFDISGIDYAELSGAIDPVIANLECASLILKTINQKAAITPYNPAVVNELIMFDYDGFCKKRGLNTIILSKVRRFLSTGDVRGLYAQAFIDIDGMISLLAVIKRSLDEKKFPEISSIWFLNQQFSETLLFGQYTSQVFKEISQKN